MSSISKLTMGEENSAAEIPSCYFLDELPVEVRLRIYEFAFQGSHQAFQGSEFRSAKFKLDTYAHQLCTSLPEAANANVRGVRGMALPALKSAFVEENLSWTASALLGTFQKLATCEMTPTLAHPVDGIVVHTKDPEKEHCSRFKMIWGEDPTGFLADRYGIDATAGVAFLFKGFVKYYVAVENVNVISCLSPKRNPLQFRNFSTGTSFEDVTGRMDDEEGYKRVM
ncbi:hypothetical protein UCDDA912_g02875 [Diaporthe ampelina]|uniref:Uncharacterized protein n=1 Tax=Diaporthe ampelina TaxID=1214573 RepID=A0A0G2FT39_9PEZI|nr:hypothetical protein UCDDA912_g02875 [Diaporthe ampelina]